MGMGLEPFYSSALERKRTSQSTVPETLAKVWVHGVHLHIAQCISAMHGTNST